ncbi:AMP-binding protein [Actinocorallia longicatena]|uniref:Fatty-acid--CoA ligase FadD4 n=1 Tax=Actinocorallia longicatena TaxID=111803 RepID=A0ABP6Q867_9ACTN
MRPPAEAARAAVRALPRAGTDPGRPAVICDSGETLTHGELADRVSRLAGELRRRGLNVGDVVAILSENSPAYLEMTWACRLAGLYHVTLNTGFRADEIAHILADSGARALLASANLPVHAELTAALAPGILHRLLRGTAHPLWEDYEEVLAAAPHFVSDTGLEGDLLQYSSGTTGRPKGIRRPLRPAPRSAAEDMFALLVGLIGVQEDSVYLCPAPLYHSAPIIWTMTALRVGATVVLSTKFDPRRTLELIEEHRVTHGQFVPTMFTRMLRLPEADRLGSDLSSLRGVVHAAAPCPVGVKRAMMDWWGPIIHEYWSSSEGAGFTFIGPDEWLAHPGSVGRSLLGALHILDEDGRDLPAGEPGLIWAEGVDFEYLNDPAKDSETTSREGWRTVGDIGRLDEDGYLYLTDRSSFMIISGGVNIYPQEAENVLAVHPLVQDVAVVGLPDADLGEVAVAVVQPVDPGAAGPDLAAELADWCAGSLARYKCPRRVLFTEELPRSDTGKLFKHRLRDTLLREGGA